MRKIRKSKPPEQAIEQYTLYHTVVYTCPYCSAQLGGLRQAGGPETCPECGQRMLMRRHNDETENPLHGV